MNVWANTVITEKGLALLAKLTQGNTLQITEAVTGAGFVTPGLLMKQTEVSDPKQPLSFRPVTYPEEGKCAIPMALKNDGLATGYKATQVGVFATDPDEGKILFFIAQAVDAASGTTIPSETEMAGYAAEWTFYFRYGQADNVEVTVDPANAVSRAEAETIVNEAVQPIAAALAGKAPAEFLITLAYGEDDSCTIDKTFAELQEAYQAGRHIRLVDTSGMEYELVAFGANYMAYFAHQLDSYRYLVRLRANNAVTLIPDLPFSESNPPTAAQVGAKRSNNVSITSGSIKTWATEQATSTSIGAHPNVTDFPETGSYWIVDLTVANSGLWRKLVATKAISNGGSPVTYECTCMSGKWSEWLKVYNEAAKPSPEDIGAAKESHPHSAMTGASQYAAGTAGMVPAPSAGNQNAFLRGDGTWATPTSGGGTADSATKLATAREIDGISFDGSANVTRYATCSTGASTRAKTASVTAGTFKLATGARVTVKFSNANTAGSATLNINNTGAKSIYWHGSALPSSQYWEAGAVLDFVYNGSAWELVGVAKDNSGIDITDLNSETWTFTLEDGSTVTKAVYVG